MIIKYRTPLIDLLNYKNPSRVLFFYLNLVILRYFNPTWTHINGIIGEGPRGITNNLMSYITKVSIG